MNNPNPTKFSDLRMLLDLREMKLVHKERIARAINKLSYELFSDTTPITSEEDEQLRAKKLLVLEKAKDTNRDLLKELGRLEDSIVQDIMFDDTPYQIGPYNILVRFRMTGRELSVRRPYNGNGR